MALAPPALRRAAAVVGMLVTLAAGAACSDDDPGGSATGSSSTSTPGTTASFEERDQAIQVSLAATGMNIVAGEVGLRAAGDGGEYCRTSAPSELAPHQAVLQEAADAEVRRLAQDALSALDQAVALCARGADPALVQQAIAGYNTQFERLRRRVEALLGTAP